MEKPKPETKMALLASEGFAAFRLTKHFYVDTREAAVLGPHPEAWEFIFKCAETGVERRWGIVNRGEALVVDDEEGN